jgi:hypothetical protein
VQAPLEREFVVLHRIASPLLATTGHRDEPISKGVSLNRLHLTETIVSRTSVRNTAFLTKRAQIAGSKAKWSHLHKETHTN